MQFKLIIKCLAALFMIMPMMAFQKRIVRLSVPTLMLVLLVLLALSCQQTMAGPIASRDLDGDGQLHGLQAVEKRRNAEFINGLLTMERLNAMGKRSPMPTNAADEVALFWRPQHPFFWTN